MMSYSNIYGAIPICLTHALTEPVRTLKFSSDNACDKIVACRTHARVVARATTRMRSFSILSAGRERF